AQIGEGDAMIAGLGQLRGSGQVVALALQLIEIGIADIVEGHGELLVDARPAHPACREGLGEARVGKEAAPTRPPAAPGDALAVERAGIAGDPEADRTAVAGELASGQALEHRKVDGAALPPLAVGRAAADLE